MKATNGHVLKDMFHFYTYSLLCEENEIQFRNQAISSVNVKSGLFSYSNFHLARKSLQWHLHNIRHCSVRTPTLIWCVLVRVEDFSPKLINFFLSTVLQPMLEHHFNRIQLFPIPQITVGISNTALCLTDKLFQ